MSPAFDVIYGLSELSPEISPKKTDLFVCLFLPAHFSSAWSGSLFCAVLTCLALFRKYVCFVSFDLWPGALTQDSDCNVFVFLFYSNLILFY